MKKEFIIVGSIIIFITVINILSQWYVNNFFDAIINDINSIEEKIMKNDFESGELEANINDVMSKWWERYDFFACFLEHDELEKVEIQMIAINANIAIGDYGKGVDEIEKCKFILKHIEKKDSLKVVNIF
ncbi:MAG: DUF4363 family protein [Clostridia bacterium]|nr:DUF4363 family protein [Clostridia bacterium]